MKKSVATSAADVWRILGEVAEAQKRHDEERKKMAAEVAEAQKRNDEERRKMAAEVAEAQKRNDEERRKMAAEVAEAQKRNDEERKKMAAEVAEAQKRNDEERKKRAAEVAEAQKRNDEERKKRAAKMAAKMAAEVAEAKKRTEEAHQKAEDARQQAEESHKALSDEVQSLTEQIKKASGLFQNTWGQFLEDLCAGDFLDLIEQVGIKGVHEMAQNIERKTSRGKVLAEFDILGGNTSEAVVGEVKTHLTRNKIDDFVDKIKKHGPKMSILKHYNHVYGAVIFLKAEKGAVEYAMAQGLVAIKSPGGKTKVSALVNKKGFKPKALIG